MSNPQPDLAAAATTRHKGDSKKATRQLLRANLRSHARRYVATGLAVAISVAFVVVALALGAGMSNATTAVIRDQYEGAAEVITVDWNKVPTDATGESQAPDLRDVIPILEQTEGVTSVGQTSYAWLEVRGENRMNTNITIANPDPLNNPTIVSGSLPQTANQIALSTGDAAQLGVGVGDTVTVDESSGDTSTQMTVSGLWKDRTTASWGAVVTAEGATQLISNYSPDSLLVAGDSAHLSNAQQDALAQTIKSAIGDSYSVRTAHAVIDENLQNMNIGNSANQAMLLVFPLIAVAVAAIVVSTTFQIVLQQRRRELALLRTLGASVGQVRSLIRREAVAVGAVAAFVGVLFGYLLSAIALKLTGITETLLEGFSAQRPLQLVVVWVIGTFVTFLIGMRPAAGVARISPIEALAPYDEFGASARKNHRVRLWIGILIAAAGAAGMAFGIHMDDSGTGFFVAFFSGLVCLVGALLITSVLLPRLTFALGMPFRGVVAKIAKANTLRNPDRTASTGTAIVIGVTLITTMLVAAGSMRATLFSEVDSSRPFDLVVQDKSSALSRDIVSRIRDIDGVAATEEVSIGRALANTDGSLSFTDQDADASLTVIGEPDLNSVAHSTVPVMSDDALRYNPEDPSVAGIITGDTVKLCSTAGECRTLTAQEDTRLNAGQVVVSSSTLESLDPNRTLGELYVKLSDNADATTVQSDILSINQDLDVSGAAAERALYTQIINTVLAVVIGLLAVSVLVALVGVANTLSLSVAERTRENGLLRALGFTKKQMQRMLAAESLYIALSGAIVGLGLGILFGWVGVLAMPLEVSHTIIVIPWIQILGVIAVAIVSALLAAWWPGRKAARTSPVEALATE